MLRKAPPDGRCRRWIVGGPSRSGKTLLVAALNEVDGPTAGFPVEALFNHFERRRYPFFRWQCAAILRDYLTRPRFIDEKRRKTKRPVDFFGTPLDRILAAIPAGLDHQIALIGWALDRFAAERGRRSWAAVDLHPEFRYHRLRRHIPGLGLAVMLRDPREVICAALYWRDYPRRAQAASLVFPHRLLSWVASAVTARHFAERLPDTVRVFSFNALLAGEAGEVAKFRDTFAAEPSGFRRLVPGPLHFAYDAGVGFYGPDGAWRALLTAHELALIEAATAPEMADLGLVPRAGEVTFTAGERRLLAYAAWTRRLARISPGLAKQAADHLYLRRTMWDRQVNRSKWFLRNSWDGLRLALRGLPE